MFDFKNTPITEDITLEAVWDCPLLLKLAAQLETGEAETNFPIGTEIPDKWNGENYPLIVGHYKEIDGKLAVGLFRKYVLKTDIMFGSSWVYNYPTSQIFEWLNSEYLSLCSNALKEVISEAPTIYFPRRSSADQMEFLAKWNLFSSTEVSGENLGEGEVWQYWSEQAGGKFTTSAVEGRKAYLSDGTTGYYWFLRTPSTSSATLGIVMAVNDRGNNGAITGNSSWNNTATVRPFCWLIAKK